MSSICSFDDGSNEKSINQPKKSEDSESDMAWTTEFIPETCFFKGKTFRQQVSTVFLYLPLALKSKPFDFW